MPKNRRSPHEGIKLLNQHVIRTVGSQTIFTIPVEEIKAIGEFTTAEGPFLDDWFITLITKNRCYDISMNINGIDDLLINLEMVFRIKLSCQLTNSTSWKTRIMYPEKLEEKELYINVREKSKSFLKRIFGHTDVIKKLSPEILPFLGN
ncbi:hypothetical protein ACFOG5_19600 [Pedobacter fastidiosus]|uniref:LAGLIDADG endonuclease n=1 Tax=Pedobacter fastidiosus TaxID=2765361 RepID=A0ABR7KYE7_9SPHI|nr:hypothetical protein [Pedobacter fastidiosus]MBC6113148.1 hypothetical protein [Pedobacter fastidiosus]